MTASANAAIAAKRTAWGKLHNAGQICIAPNYVLVHPSQEQAFVQGFIQALSTYLPNGAKGTPDMASIIDGRSFERVKGLLQTTKGTILCGGGVDERTRFIEPTLVKVNDVGDALMNEEIFGPVLAMLVVDNVDEMLSIARGAGETPLAMYVFSSEKEEQEKCKCPALVRVSESRGRELTRISNAWHEIWRRFNQRVSPNIIEY